MWKTITVETWLSSYINVISETNLQVSVSNRHMQCFPSLLVSAWSTLSLLLSVVGADYLLHEITAKQQFDLHLLCWPLRFSLVIHRLGPTNASRFLQSHVFDHQENILECSGGRNWIRSWQAAGTWAMFAQCVTVAVAAFWKIVLTSQKYQTSPWNMTQQKSV